MTEKEKQVGRVAIVVLLGAMFGVLVGTWFVIEGWF